MTIIERIDSDLKEGMKAKNESVVSSLRMVKSAFKNKQIDLGHPLTDEEATLVLRTIVKQYRDALSDFTSAGRTDLMEKQKAEIELLERYLPADISEGEIEAIIKKAVADTGATSGEFAKVMGIVMKEVAGRADGNAVRAIVQRLLA
ncbi:GatB/YqeY domain-containing protein [Patescibacteria group bacterium]|nr:GatB/YqeY domain-containing protein [Patescibacteria group bacterium]